ncbi:MAG: ribosome recycling factor [Flavobacteriales bacterium]|jgi:ribosome recycling factor
MSEELDMIMAETEEAMRNSIIHLNSDLNKVRAGRATPAMLDSVKVDYYGTPTPLSQVGSVNTLDSRTLTIQPWEKAILDEIAKGVMNANLGLNPQSNGEMIIISVPVLTEERRKDLVKKAKADGEHCKVGIRSKRKDANDFIKSLKNEGLNEDQVKGAESAVQEMTNKYISQVDDILTRKEVDIMKV